jgi:hypothetical protein
MLNNVLPVLACVYFAFCVFAIDRKELATRLGIVVTLFLGEENASLGLWVRI